jgi:hypothetical protein
MRLWHRLTLAFLLLLLASAAFAQTAPAPAPAQPNPPGLNALLSGTDHVTWLRKTPEVTAILTFYADGKFESLVLYKFSALMPKGAQAQCSGTYILEGQKIVTQKRTCDMGDGIKTATPGAGIEIVSLDAAKLVLKFEDGGTFDFQPMS